MKFYAILEPFNRPIRTGSRQPFGFHNHEPCTDALSNLMLQSQRPFYLPFSDQRYPPDSCKALLFFTIQRHDDGLYFQYLPSLKIVKTSTSNQLFALEHWFVCHLVPGRLNLVSLDVSRSAVKVAFIEFFSGFRVADTRLPTQSKFLRLSLSSFIQMPTSSAIPRMHSSFCIY